MITIASIDVGDGADAWVAAGFTVDDDAAPPECHIGSVRVRLLDDGKRIRGWALRGAGDGPMDGIPTAASDDPPAAPATHPNGTLAIDHVVLASPDPARTTAALEARGLARRRTRRTDTYGAPMLQTFFRAGDVIIELVGPEVPDPSVDAPAGFFGLALTVADLDATADRLGDALGRVKDAVQPGRRIATLRHRDLGLTVPIAFMSPDP